MELFNRTFREDVLDQHLFLNFEEGRETTHWWIGAAYTVALPPMTVDHTTPLNGVTPHQYR